MIRTVEFVDPIELPFVGNIDPLAVQIGDVDDDGDNELIIGNIAGVLGVFKYGKLWRVTKNLGTITSVAIGDIRNHGKNTTCVVTAEGSLHVIDMPAPSDVALERLSGTEPIPDLPYIVDHHEVSVAIPMNVARILIADITGDSQNEIVLARTDRQVHSFRLDTESRGAPFLIELNSWAFDDQLGTLAVSKDENGDPVLLVTQYGGAVIVINKYGEKIRTITVDRSEANPKFPEVATELVSELRTGPENEFNIAIVMMNGTIALHDLIHSITKHHDLKVNQNLFAVSKADITGDGMDEIITCSWSGMTFISDRNFNLVQFQFPQRRVCAFVAGHYAVTRGKNEPSLIYVTFEDKIVVYNNIRLKSILHRNFLDVIGSTLDSNANLIKEKFGYDVTTLEGKRAFIESCLYPANSIPHR